MILQSWHTATIFEVLRTHCLYMQRDCLDRLSERAIPEFAGFAFSLSRRLSNLLTQGVLQITNPIWSLAVEGILVRLVDADTKVHEEVLRLLLLAASSTAQQLDVKDVSRLLTSTLANSQRSREAYANRNAELAALPPFPWSRDGLGGGGGLAGGGGEGSDDDMGEEREGYPLYGRRGLPQATEERGGDGVRGTYALFTERVPGFTPELAPEVFAYLQE